MLEDLSFLPPDPSSIDDIVLDTSLLAHGYELHYIVDPFDIITFCFPWKRLATGRPEHKRLLSNSLLALYEIFYNHRQRPILLDEYAYELTETATSIGREAESGTEVASRLLPIDHEPRASDDTLQLDIGRNFIHVLATGLDLFAQGFSRLHDVCCYRLINTIDEEDEETAYLHTVFDSNRGTDLTAEIAVGLFTALEHSYATAHRKMSVDYWERIRRSSLIDAQAVDRLLAVNQRVLVEGSSRLQRRHVFLYLSSAERSGTLFRLPQVQERLPLIDGRPVPLWRTPRQILVQMICRSDSVEEVTGRLRSIRRIIEAQRELESVGSTEMRSRLLTTFREPLDDYEQRISEHYEKAKGYGLASTFLGIDSYERLMSEAGPGSKRAQALEVLRDLMKRPGHLETARQKLQVNLFLTKVKSSLASSLLNGLARLDASQDARHAPRSGTDPVAASSQHLPAVFRAEFPHFKDLIARIGAYFRTPIVGRSGGSQLISEASAVFLERDRETDELDVEHEFVRCLLFLALPTSEGDSFALDHARDMVRRLSELSARTDETQVATLRQMEREFRYLACWAARRSSRYGLGNDLACEAIEWAAETPDPRFFHGRCLNTFAWFDDFRNTGGRGPRAGLSIATAIQDGNKAIDLYREWGDGGAEQIAAVYNTLACLYVYRLDELYDVKAARQCLDALKETSPKPGWYHYYPEFFHTEALIEYHEFLGLRTHYPADKAAMLAKLQHARREIGIAADSYPKGAATSFRHVDLIQHLLVQIDGALDELLQHP